MLVVDLMHEFKLGVWKALFTHLICVLYSAAPGGKLVALLDERFEISNLGCTLFKDSLSIDSAAYPHSARLYKDSATMYLK
jgi:hypothetical protein